MLPIVQFSPPRSGSTLCYNAIKWIVPERRIEKAHKLKYKYLICPVITTVRDPYDSVVSFAQTRGDRLTDENVVWGANEIRRGWSHLERMKFFPRVLMLPYERFLNDHDYLLDEISAFLGVSLSEERREAFKQEFDAQGLREKTKGRRFKEVDSETQLHGSHISSDLGALGKGDILTPLQREIVQDILQL